MRLGRLVRQLGRNGVRFHVYIPISALAELQQCAAGRRAADNAQRARPPTSEQHLVRHRS
jgi:hypothetical protein